MIALLAAAAVAFVVAIFGTPVLIGWLRDHGIGQPIREDGPAGHRVKAGTPTMGGLAIVGGGLLGYAIPHVSGRIVFTRGGILVVLAMAGAGFVGFLDDVIKVRNARNLGLNKKTKMAGLLAVAIAFGVLAVEWANIRTTLSFTRWDSLHVDLGPVLFVVWSVVLIIGFANAVNLTDGLDGLAGGSAVFSYASYVVIAFWIFRHVDVYQVPEALDLAVMGAAMTGACLGFLWWNAAPAQIFMGDTGALAIGAGLAALALVTKTDLLLPVLGAVYVVETMSVIIQVASFRLARRRVFRMAPIHHHFELGGWPETTVIIRFWILAGMATAVGVGIFYADYLSIPGILN